SLKDAVLQPTRSDHIVQWIAMDPLEGFHALAKLGHRHDFKNLHNRVTDFLHHAADGALVFVGAGTLLIEALTHTTDWRQRAFDVADDFREGNTIRRHLET